MPSHNKNLPEQSSFLGLSALVAYGLVFIIPIAPVTLYGYIAHESNGLVPLVYLIGAVAMIFTAFSYKKMSQAYPIGGSVFSYVGASLGKKWGFITGWIVLMDYILVPAFVYRLSATWLQDVYPAMPAALWIISVTLFNTWINCRGITLTTRMSFILLSLQILSLFAFLICAGYYLTHYNGVISYTRSLYHAEYFNMTFISTALSLALLNYLGFDGISTLAEETKDPKKSIGKAIIVTLLLIAALFILQTYVASLIGQHMSLSKETAFFDIAYEIGGPWLYGLFIVINIISIGIASALVTQAAGARLLNVMARHQSLPFSGYLSQIHTRFQTPTIATCLCGIVAIIFSLSLAQESLISLVSWGGLTAYLILNYSVIHHFFIRNNLQERKAWPTSLVLPLIGVLFIAYVWFHFSNTTLITGGVFVFVGWLFYLMQTKKYFSIN